MRIDKIENNEIFVDIPLTTQSGKTRVKVRNGMRECAYQAATRKIHSL